MATTYCTPADVANYCNIVDAEGDRAIFGTNPPLPTEAEVDDYINEAEELIEKQCETAWGTRYLQRTEEWYDYIYDYYEKSIKLEKGDVVPFDTAEGDKLEVWDGANWSDWIATYTEGRDDDFYVDYRLGKIYFQNRTPSYRQNSIKVTYRVRASSTVPKPIKVATALMAGIFLANSEYASILFPEGQSENNSAEERIGRWEAQIENRLKLYAKGENFLINTAFTTITH